MRSKPILTALTFFSVTLFLCFILFSFLKKGVHIPQISLGDVQINEFYLILDKKLNINIDNIILLSDEDKKSTPINREILEDNIRLTLKIIKNTKFLLDILGEVEIKKITVGDFVGNITLKDHKIRANIPDWRLEINLYDNADLEHLQIHIADLTHIPSQASLVGVINYDLNSAQVQFQSTLIWQDQFVFDMDFYSDFKTFNFEGRSNQFGSFSFLKSLTEQLPKEAKEWLFKRVKGDFIISKVSLQSDFAADKILKAIEENLFVEFHIYKGSVLYQESLSPVLFQEATAIYHQGRIQVNLKKPTYEKIPLTGSKLEFFNIFGNGYPTLKIDIFANTPLNDKIHRILKSYQINIPLTQKTSTVSAYLTLSIPFGRPGIDVYGNFKISKGTFDMGGMGVEIHNADIHLKDHQVAFTQAQIRMKDVIDVDSKLSLLIDTDAKIVEGVAHLNHLTLPEHEDLLYISESSLPIAGDFSGEDFLLQFPSLKTSLILNEQFKITVDELALLYPYSKLLQDYGMKNGMLTLQNTKTSEIALNANIKEHHLPIKKLDGSLLKPIDVRGNIKGDQFELSVQNDLIKIRSIKDVIDIWVKELMFSLDSEGTETQSEAKKPSQSIRVSGKSLLLEIGSNQLFVDDARLTLDKQSALKGTFKNKNTVFDVSYYDGLLSVYGSKISSELINGFLKQNAFDGGTYTLLGEYQGGIFKGNMTFKKVTIKNLLGVQNVIAFVDTIPSLLVFKSPGFDEQGYKVENGSVDFEITPDYLRVSKFQLSGHSIDSEGAGILNLNDKNLNFNVKISALKSWSTVFNAAPLVGYVITGDDGSFSTFMKITGTLHKPHIGVDLTNKIIQAPTILIERTIKTPIKLFEQFFQR